MKGRIKMMQLLPVLNLLSRGGVISPKKLQDYAIQASQRPSLTTKDVITDLYGFDVPDDKYEQFAAVLSSLEKLAETEGGNKQCII